MNFFSNKLKFTDNFAVANVDSYGPTDIEKLKKGNQLKILNRIQRIIRTVR